jgi:uncharacterized RDD family membrane protein YckC
VTSPEPPTHDNPARWAADPLGRHEYRYWDGSQWTEHVSDNGIVGTDPPVAPPVPSAEPTPDDAGYAAPSGLEPAPTSGGFGATHLGAPVAGTGAAAWSSAAPTTTYDPTEVLGRRYGAFVIDAVISLIVFGAFFFATASTHPRAEMLRVPGCHLSASDSAQVECDNRAVVTVNDTVYEAEGGPYFLACIAFTLVYFALMEGLAGATLGKLMTGLRVVTPEGAKCGLGRALLRWLVFAVDGPLSLFLCGIITSAVSAGHRRLGDMAATTYVIGKADEGRPVVVRGR